MQLELFHFILLLACAMVYLSPLFCHSWEVRPGGTSSKAESLSVGRGSLQDVWHRGSKQHTAVEMELAPKPKAPCSCHTFGYRPRAVHCQLHKQQPKLKFCFTG